MPIDWAKMKTAEQQAEDARKALVPFRITRGQGTAMLKISGLWVPALAYVAGLVGTERILADTALMDSVYWLRESEFLDRCAAALNLSSDELDDLFIQAGQINYV